MVFYTYTFCTLYSVSTVNIVYCVCTPVHFNKVYSTRKLIQFILHKLFEWNEIFTISVSFTRLSYLEKLFIYSLQDHDHEHTNSFTLTAFQNGNKYLSIRFIYLEIVWKISFSLILFGSIADHRIEGLKLFFSVFFWRDYFYKKIKKNWIAWKRVHLRFTVII